MTKKCDAGCGKEATTKLQALDGTIYEDCSSCANIVAKVPGWTNLGPIAPTQTVQPQPQSNNGHNLCVSCFQAPHTYVVEHTTMHSNHNICYNCYQILVQTSYYVGLGPINIQPVTFSPGTTTTVPVGGVTIASSPATVTLNGPSSGYAYEVKWGQGLDKEIERASKCECGAHKVGSESHSTWCQMYSNGF